MIMRLGKYYLKIWSVWLRGWGRDLLMRKTDEVGWDEDVKVDCESFCILGRFSFY